MYMYNLTRLDHLKQRDSPVNPWLTRCRTACTTSQDSSSQRMLPCPMSCSSTRAQISDKGWVGRTSWSMDTCNLLVAVRITQVPQYGYQVKSAHEPPSRDLGAAFDG